MPFGVDMQSGDAPHPGRSLAPRALVPVVIAAVFAGLACSESSGSTSRQQVAGEPSGGATAVLDEFSQRIETVLAREAARRARRAAIADRLQSKASGGDEDVDGELGHRRILAWLYGRRGYRPVWHGGGAGFQRREAAERVHRRLVRGVERHGLWPGDLHLQALRRLDRQQTDGGVRTFDRLELNSRQRESLRRHLRESNESLDGSDAVRRVARAAAEPDGPTPELAARVGDRVAALQEPASRVAAREVLLSDAVAEYLLEMKYANSAWFEDRRWRATMRVQEYGLLLPPDETGIDEPEPPNVTRELGEALQKARGKARAASRMAQLQDAPGEVDGAMADAQPPYRQYERLVEAFTHYRKLVEQGGWPSIPPRAVGLREGRMSPLVERLERRLRIEGYFDGEPDEFFDRRTTEALREYQETHQLWAHDKVSAQSRRSLDVSAEERWHQIRVTLERWRESRIGGDSHYVFVNIPDFHGEVWRDGEREMRFRVITGKSDVKRMNPPEEKEDEDDEDDEADEDEDEDEDGEGTGDGSDGEASGEEEENNEDEKNEDEKEEEQEQTPRVPPEERKWHRPFATPRFSDYLQYVVLNPYWNVPNSIWQQEIKPKLEEKPDYYEKNGFEVVTEPNGHRFLRQKPGPENALGKVKFLFPNGHSVYMHDTPEKFLFDKPIRDFSHGCIRVQKPMKLLDYMLDLDGRWEGEARKERKKHWFGKDEESWVRLRQGLPVHIEYYVVRVDDSGRANFLADIYDADEPRIEAVAERMKSLPDGYDLPIADHDELMRQALSGEFDGDDVGSYSAH